MDIGAGDPAGVPSQDDGPIHLGQLGEALRAELGIEQEAAGADGEHVRAVPDHDERPHIGLKDPVQALS